MTIFVSHTARNINTGPRAVIVRDGETPEDAATRFLIEEWGYTPGFTWSTKNELGFRTFIRDGTMYDNIRKGGLLQFQGPTE